MSAQRKHLPLSSIRGECVPPRFTGKWNCLGTYSLCSPRSANSNCPPWVDTWARPYAQMGKECKDVNLLVDWLPARRNGQGQSLRARISCTISLLHCSGGPMCLPGGDAFRFSPSGANAYHLPSRRPVAAPQAMASFTKLRILPASLKMERSPPVSDCGTSVFKQAELLPMYYAPKLLVRY